MTLGTPPGIIRTGTITQYNGDGTVLVKLNQGESFAPAANISVPISTAWTGKDGQFMGGYPDVGTSIIMAQGAGGQWQILSQISSDNIFDGMYIAAGCTKMDELQPGRALIQVKDQTYLYVDPVDGIVAGRADNSLQADPIKNIISHNFEREMSFTEGARKIDGVIKRDMVVNANRNVIGSTLDSHIYDESLRVIGIDPMTRVGVQTTGTNVRNPPLVENREVVYEVANSFSFDTDLEEGNKYSGDPQPEIAPLIVNRRNMRTDAFSLSLEHPNHLIEIVKGTAIDTFGNVLDINRSALPIGKTKDLNLEKSEQKEDTFIDLRRLHRRAIAFHWELNARKDLIEPANRIGVQITDRGTPDVNSSKDYARDRSRFFVDIDKEGQFKINIPASSETGNVPLLTRYENHSVIAAAQKPKEINPNSFVRSTDSKEIFLESFASSSGALQAASIELVGGGGDLDGFAAPTDNNTEDAPIKYGTAYHNIRNVCSEFQTTRILTEGSELVSFDSSIPVINPDIVAPFDQFVSPTITVFGDEADAGGRSGSVNLDGFCQLNIGANTIDRQSLHYDFAGGVIGRIGRDKQNVSYAASLDGDMFLQIGGDGLPSSLDSRFETENVTRRNGTLDIRVYINGQMAIFRIAANSDGSAGIDLISPGNVSIFSAKDITLKSKVNLNLEAEFINMYAGTEKKLVNRFPKNTIA